MDDLAQLLERALREELEVAPRQALALDDLFGALGDARSMSRPQTTRPADVNMTRGMTIDV